MSERFSWENLRPWPAYAVAASVPISLAATNIFKAVLLVFALSLLIGAVAGRRRLEPLQAPRTLLVIALMLGALALISVLVATRSAVPEPLEDQS